MILDAMRLRWRDRDATRVGRRGQRQDGVDIHRRDPVTGDHLGAQAKNRDTLAEAEIDMHAPGRETRCDVEKTSRPTFRHPRLFGDATKASQGRRNDISIRSVPRLGEVTPRSDPTPSVCRSCSSAKFVLALSVRRHARCGPMPGGSIEAKLWRAARSHPRRAARCAAGSRGARSGRLFGHGSSAMGAGPGSAQRREGPRAGRSARDVRRCTARAAARRGAVERARSIRPRPGLPCWRRGPLASAFVRGHCFVDAWRHPRWTSRRPRCAPA